jgi:cbb3-type cytochrome oxidase maturation protein
MDILYLLIPLSVVLVFVIGFFFFRSLKGGQFEDLEGPAYRILMDDDTPIQSTSEQPVRTGPGDADGHERQI